MKTLHLIKKKQIILIKMRNYIVLGSFFGDEGKGQVVHNICKDSPIDDTIVVRFSGGHQVGHTVRHGRLEHTFSNFGSGTLLGIPTYWTQFCTVDPITSMDELQDLNKIGITPEIYYHPLCQIVTPFDVYNQWNDEENRRHGTVGTGFKSTLDRVKSGYSLTVMDCKNIMVLRSKIASLMANYFNVESTYPMQNMDEWCFKVYNYFKSVHICDDSILDGFVVRVFEGSQGILLDQTFGVMPYCTPSNTTCKNAMSMVEERHTEHIYVIRPYITRHGNGPLLTTTSVRLVKDRNNEYNEFQQSLRAVEFDPQLLQHSVRVDSQFFKLGRRHLAITHHDEMKEDFLNTLPRWFDSIHCYHYDYRVK